jgi:AraC-like DNA-binding protein
MISGGGSSLSDVAQDSGFCDHSHMTHSFRRTTGLTPSMFRRMTRRASQAEQRSTSDLAGPL